MKLLYLFLIVTIVYILLLRGRSGHPGLKKLRGWKYAHRGLHGNGVPENSMPAFEKALEHGYGIELDVHLLADGELAVIHDSKLARTTGAEGRVEELTVRDLPHYHLEGTGETIPLFTNVLKLYEGKAPIIVELKVEGNNDALCETVSRVLDEYRGVYCVESFDPRAVAWFRKHRPDVVRGQLTENYFKSPKSTLHWGLKFVLSRQLLNCWTAPDFVAWRCADRKNLGNLICRKLWRMQGVTWTIKSQAEFDEAVKDGWLPIFEGFTP